jgi:type IV pilus assembly protein PilA
MAQRRAIATRRRRCAPWVARGGMTAAGAAVTGRARAGTRTAAGFTLLEVTVAMAIVAIIATLAVPGMVNGIVRRQIVEAVPLADVVKNAVAQSWASVQALPSDNASAGLPPATKIVNNYVSSVELVGGAINITFGNSAHRMIAGKVLTLRPAVVADAPVVPVAWVCAGAAVPGGMTVLGADRTDVPRSVLPYNCQP